MSACASNPSKLAPTNFNQNSSNGLMIGTITIIDEKPRYNSYDFFYRPINVKKGHRINIRPNSGGLKKSFEPDYIDGNKMTFQFALEHPQGKYEFWSFSLFSNLGYIQDTFRPKENFSIPIELKKGTITYIGNIVFYPQGNDNGYQIEWTNNSENDIAKFREKYPNYNWSNMTISVPVSGENLTNKLIEFKK